MRHELHNLGFNDVVEMPHGEPFALEGGTRVAAFQYGPDDSAIVIARDGVVLADLNDCKISGSAARAILKSFGAPTFVFKSHSFAQAYPNCYAIADPADGGLVIRDDFVTTFLHTMRELQPRYAVPFASMVAFLHPESQPCNMYAVRPPEVAAAVAASDIAPTTQAVLMTPGDTWDSSSGFHLTPNDYYVNQVEWLERLARDVESKIQQEESAERGVTLAFDHFEQYFLTFLRSLPPFVGLALRRPIVFRVPSSDQPYWALNFTTRTVHCSSEPPADRASIIRIREAILVDAIAKKVVAFIHISMRIRIELARGGAQTDFLFWGLLTLYELGYLPLRNVMTLRALGVLWRRRPEVGAFLRSLFTSRRSLEDKILGTLMSRGQRRAR